MKTIGIFYKDLDTQQILQIEYPTELIYKDIEEFNKFLIRELRLVIHTKELRKKNEIIELERN